MAAWVLVPCLVSLRAEFNTLAPGRDRASDGSIGDAAHAGSSSDHNPDETGATPYEDADSINEVHAIDVDRDLNRSGWSMNRAVEIIVTRHRSGRDDRLQNVIWDRRIWSRSWGWTARTYTGSNPHDKHAHFSARYTTAQEQDTSPWGLLEAEEDMALSAEDKAWIVANVGPAPTADATVKRLHDDLTDSSTGLYRSVPDRAKAGFVAALSDGNAAATGQAPEGTAGQPHRFIRDALRNVVGAPVDQGAILAAVAGLDQVDEQALGAVVVAGLTPVIMQGLADAGAGTDLGEAEVEAVLRRVLGSLG